jgi:hypothetical protein
MKLDSEQLQQELKNVNMELYREKEANKVLYEENENLKQPLNLFGKQKKQLVVDLKRLLESSVENLSVKLKEVSDDTDDKLDNLLSAFIGN